MIGVESLDQAVRFLTGHLDIRPLVINIKDVFSYQLNNYDADFADVNGQDTQLRVKYQVHTCLRD